MADVENADAGVADAGRESVGAGADDRRRASIAINLGEGLSALSQLSSAELNLEQLLARVAALAVAAIPGADGAGLILLEPVRVVMVGHSADVVRAVDDIQCRLGEGPCISAALQGEAMRSGSLDDDPRWPQFGPQAGRLGVHSALSLPLRTPAVVVGAVNVYAHARGAFDDRSEQLGVRYAGPAAVTVHNALILAQTARLAIELETRLRHRPVIEQAVGILRARSGLNATEALLRLERMGRHERIELAVVAGRVVDDAVRRGQARRPPSS